MSSKDFLDGGPSTGCNRHKQRFSGGWIPELKNVISHPGGDEESASWGFGGLIQIAQENHIF